MSIFDDKEQLMKKDAEFLSKMHQLIEDVYGPRNSPFEDGVVMETLIAGLAQHQANILLMVGGINVEEGYSLLGSSQEQAATWFNARLQALIEKAFESMLIAFNSSAPQSVLDERELIRQELDLDMQSVITEPAANTKILAS